MPKAGAATTHPAPASERCSSWRNWGSSMGNPKRNVQLDAWEAMPNAKITQRLGGRWPVVAGGDATIRQCYPSSHQENRRLTKWD
jgi:hypothetical protein